MAKRIFLGLFVVGVLVFGAVAFYSYTWLGSIGDPSIASEGFAYHSGFAWMILWASLVILTLVSLFLVWESGIRWSGIATFLFFTVGSLLLLFNDNGYKQFLSDNGLKAGNTLLNPFFLAVMILVIAVFLIASHMITFRLSVRAGRRDDEEPSSTKESEAVKKKEEEGDDS
ncbi:MAG: hypothetical protein HKN33_16680 [Pyrinomonadaceae bacterium]|nr:hypothetical protein [Pyrinomonadaceae bacterium]